MKKEYLIGLGLLAVVAFLYMGKKREEDVDMTSLEEEIDVDTTSTIPLVTTTGQVVDLAELDIAELDGKMLSR
jgi:hypothetical protein